MQIFDLTEIKPAQKAEVFFEVDEFNMRIVRLSAGEEIPACEMSTYVIFAVLDGEAKATVDGEETGLQKGECLVTGPVTLSLKTKKGVKIMGIQVSKG